MEQLFSLAGKQRVAERFRPVEAAQFALLLLAKCHSFLIRLMGANRGGRVGVASDDGSQPITML